MTIEPGRNIAVGSKVRVGLLRRVGPVLALTVVMLGMVGGLGSIWCGSFASAVAFLRGDGVIPDAYLKSFGSAPVGSEPEVHFQLWNRTARVVRILGAKTSCTCVVTSDLPREVVPGARTDLVVTVHAKKAGRLLQRLQVITDDRTSPSPFLTVVGAVTAKAAAAAP